MKLLVSCQSSQCNERPRTKIHDFELSRRGLKFDTHLQKLNQAGFVVCAFDVPNYLEAGNCHVVIKHISKEAN